MSYKKTSSWTRRRLLSTMPVALAPALLSGSLRAALPAGKVCCRGFRVSWMWLTPPALRRRWSTASRTALHTLWSPWAPAALSSTTTTTDGWTFLSSVDGGWKTRRPSASNRLYKNNRDGTFTDVTAKAGFGTRLGAGRLRGRLQQRRLRGSVPHLLRAEHSLSQQRRRNLYRCNGQSRVALSHDALQHRLHLCGLQPRWPAGSVCFQLSRNRSGQRAQAFDGRAQLQLSRECRRCAGPGLPKAQNYLYRNNGDGTFTDVSKESGVAGLRGSYGLTAISIDADEDGWPDIFVACDSTPSCC